MPFGLKNAAQAFQRLMDVILSGIIFTFAYLDNILVASSRAEEHRQHLRELFKLLSSHGISLNRKKCTSGQSSVKYLGHQVSKMGISPLQSRVEDLQVFPPPTTKEEDLTLLFLSLHACSLVLVTVL